MNRKYIHRELYNRLFVRYGDLGWWPADSREEVIIGAVLTQNTSWKNVEKSLDKLRKNSLITLSDIATAPPELVMESIRSSGFYNQKSLYLRELSRKITEKYGTLENLQSTGQANAKDFLLSSKGVGYETMESIMLYALDFPVSVVDAYTIRILGRILGKGKFRREKLREEMESDLNWDVDRLKNYHAMTVQLAKDFCRKKPLCVSCPLKNGCSYFMDLSSP